MKHFVYILIRPDGRVFYVGKGTRNRRVLTHRNEAKNGHACHKCNLIRQIWSEGKDFTYEIVFRTDDENEAFAHERTLIAFHGRKNLTNLTDGGEGMAGHFPSAETRAKIGAKSKGNTHRRGHRHLPEVYAKIADIIRTPEVRAKLRAANLGKRMSEASRQKLSQSKTGKSVPKLQGKKLSPEHIEKRTLTRKANRKESKPLSAEHKAKLSLARMGHTVTPETRAKIRQANMGNENWRFVKNHHHLPRKPFTEEHRKHLSESAKKRGISPETRAKISLSLTGKHHVKRRIGRPLSETHKKAIGEGLKGHILSPETRQKISDAHKGKPKKRHTGINPQGSFDFLAE